MSSGQVSATFPGLSYTTEKKKQNKKKSGNDNWQTDTLSSDLALQVAVL